MTWPRELVEAFAERLRADIEAVRVHNDGRVGIHTSDPDAGRFAAVVARVPGATAELEPTGPGGAGERLVFRADADVVAAAMGEDLEAIATELAGEAECLAELVIPDAPIRSAVLVVAAAELAAVWPEPDRERWPVWGAVSPTRPRARRIDELPRALPDVATWGGGPWRERYGPALAAVIPPDLRAGVGFFGSLTLRAIDGTTRLTIPPDALGVLYRAERAELWRTRATFAAGEAFAAMRALAGATNPGPAHFAAVVAALELADPDPLAAGALADAGKRSQYAGELLTAAASVARLFEEAPPATEDEARATVPTIHGPALRWDAAFANLLESMGGTRAAELAGKVRTQAAELAAAALNPVIPGTRPPPPGGLWLLWADLEPGDAPRWLRVLARVLWADKWRPALEQGKAAAVSMPALFAVLSIRGGKPVGETWHADGRAFAALRADGGGFPVMHLDMAGIPASIAERLLGGDLGPLRGRAGLAALDTLVRSLDDDLRRQPYDGRRVPKVAIPAGRGLAEACGMPSKGTTARDLDEAVQAWAAVVLKGPNGARLRFLLSPEYRAAAPGRPAAWLLTPGELLLPTGLTADASKLARYLPRSERAYRRIVPWPDVRAPDGYARDRDRADADALALALVLTWAEQATAERGRAWQARPGVLADDAGWRALVARAHADVLGPLRTRALDALGDAGWVTVDGDRVAPGPALPRLAATLNGAARGARDKARPKKQRT